MKKIIRERNGELYTSFEQPMIKVEPKHEPAYINFDTGEASGMLKEAIDFADFEDEMKLRNKKRIIAIEDARRNKSKETLITSLGFGMAMSGLLSALGPYFAEPPMHNPQELLELGVIGTFIAGGTVFGLYKAGQHIYHMLREKFGDQRDCNKRMQFLRREYPDADFLLENGYDRT